MKIRLLLSVLALFGAMLSGFAQIPATQGLSLKWQYVFQDLSTDPPTTSLYPEDVLSGADGSLHFLHNVGLLEGSVVTSINPNGGLLKQTSQRIANIGYRMVGVSLEQGDENTQWRMLGQALFNNNVQAIPPVGRFAISRPEGMSSSITLPENQQEALRSLNDRGLPWIIRAADNTYFVVEPRVTSDNQYVAWIRKAEASSAKGKDTLAYLPRPKRNGLPLGTTFEESRIRGLAQLAPDRYAFLYSQPGNYADTARVAVQLVIFNTAGDILKVCDLSAACGYTFFPQLLCANGFAFVYGEVAPTLFNSPNTAHTALAIVDAEGSIAWEGSIDKEGGEQIAFTAADFYADGQALILAGESLDAAGNTQVNFYRWGLGDAIALERGTLRFEDNHTRVHLTGMTLDAAQNAVLSIQLDQFPNEPQAGQNPEKVFHAAVAVRAEALGLVSVAADATVFAAASIQPNPGTGFFRIDGLPEGRLFRCEVFDLMGRRYRDFNYPAGSGFVLAGDLSAGLYMIRLSDEQGRSGVFRWRKE
jgi:hypothetical protein